jgi:excisionase family DNA binding protein
LTTPNDHEHYRVKPDATWLTLVDLANMLQITERHVRRLVAEKRIPFTKVGGRLRFNLARILEWLEDNSDGPDPSGHGNAA